MYNDGIIKKRILIVDDDEEMLDLLQLFLQKEGCSTMVSLNGKNVMEMIIQDRPDLILLDIQMKGVNGEDICRQIKSNNDLAQIQVIICSANANISLISTQCGANEYIAKPFELKTIKDICHRC